MRKLLTICLVLMICASAFAVPRDWERARIGYYSGPIDGTDQDDNILSDNLIMHREIAGLGRGHIIYVNSGAASGGDGSTWEQAYTTIDAGISVCSSARGDIVKVAEGHLENLTTASAIAFDVKGVRVLGMGREGLRPRITVASKCEGLFWTASCMTVENIDWIASVSAACDNAVPTIFTIASGADYFSVKNCGLSVASPAICTNLIDIGEGIDNGYIGHNTIETGEDDTITAANAIRFSTVSSLLIEGNTITGNCSTAVLNNTKIAAKVVVQYNTLFNGDLTTDSGLNAQPAIEFADSTTGLIQHNNLASAAGAVSMRVADDCTFIGNFAQESDGDEFEGTYAGIYSTDGSANDIASSVVD